MDIQAIKEGLTNTGSVIGILKSVKDALPSGKKRDEAERLLADAEQKMKENLSVNIVDDQCLMVSFSKFLWIILREVLRR